MPNSDLEGGTPVPPVSLRSSNGDCITLSYLKGMTVVYAYPRTSPPNAAPIAGWDLIPGARGCTSQSCGFRDHFAELKQAGVDHIFGLSTQDSGYQAEVVERLALPFSLLSDADLQFANTIGLQTFSAGGMTLLSRATLILRDGVVEEIMASVDQPSHNASDVVALLLRRSSK